MMTNDYVSRYTDIRYPAEELENMSVADEKTAEIVISELEKFANWLSREMTTRKYNDKN